FDRDYPELSQPSGVINILLDREFPPRGAGTPPAFWHATTSDREPGLYEVALVVRPKMPGARAYYLLPWDGRVLAGTFHRKRPGGAERPPPGEELLERLLRELNAAFPGFHVSREDVSRVHWG